MVGGKFPRQYDTSVNRTNKAFIQAAYRNACTKKYRKHMRAQTGVPVTIVIQARSPLPTHRPKRVQSEPFIVKPDVDNIAKLVLDALNGLAYADDKQVVGLMTIKKDRFRDVEPCTEVTISYRSEDD